MHQDLEQRLRDSARHESRLVEAHVANGILTTRIRRSQQRRAVTAGLAGLAVCGGIAFGIVGGLGDVTAPPAATGPTGYPSPTDEVDDVKDSGQHSSSTESYTLPPNEYFEDAVTLNELLPEHPDLFAGSAFDPADGYAFSIYVTDLTDPRAEALLQAAPEGLDVNLIEVEHSENDLRASESRLIEQVGFDNASGFLVDYRQNAIVVEATEEQIDSAGGFDKLRDRVGEVAKPIDVHLVTVEPNVATFGPYTGDHPPEPDPTLP